MVSFTDFLPIKKRNPKPKPTPNQYSSPAGPQQPQTEVTVGEEVQTAEKLAPVSGIDFTPGSGEKGIIIRNRRPGSGGSGKGGNLTKQDIQELREVETKQEAPIQGPQKPSTTQKNVNEVKQGNPFFAKTGLQDFNTTSMSRNVKTKGISYAGFQAGADAVGDLSSSLFLQSAVLPPNVETAMTSEELRGKQRDIKNELLGSELSQIKNFAEIVSPFTSKTTKAEATADFITGVSDFGSGKDGGLITGFVPRLFKAQKASFDFAQEVRASEAEAKLILDKREKQADFLEGIVPKFEDLNKRSQGELTETQANKIISERDSLIGDLKAEGFTVTQGKDSLSISSKEFETDVGLAAFKVLRGDNTFEKSARISEAILLEGAEFLTGSTAVGKTGVVANLGGKLANFPKLNKALDIGGKGLGATFIGGNALFGGLSGASEGMIIEGAVLGGGIEAARLGGTVGGLKAGTKLYQDDVIAALEQGSFTKTQKIKLTQNGFSTREYPAQFTDETISIIDGKPVVSSSGVGIFETKVPGTNIKADTIVNFGSVQQGGKTVGSGFSITEVQGAGLSKPTPSKFGFIGKDKLVTTNVFTSLDDGVAFNQLRTVNVPLKQSGFSTPSGNQINFDTSIGFTKKSQAKLFFKGGNLNQIPQFNVQLSRAGVFGDLKFSPSSISKTRSIKISDGKTGLKISDTFTTRDLRSLSEGLNMGINNNRLMANLPKGQTGKPPSLFSNKKGQLGLSFGGNTQQIQPLIKISDPAKGRGVINANPIDIAKNQINILTPKIAPQINLQISQNLGKGSSVSNLAVVNQPKLRSGSKTRQGLSLAPLNINKQDTPVILGNIPDLYQPTKIGNRQIPKPAITVINKPIIETRPEPIIEPPFVPTFTPGKPFIPKFPIFFPGFGLDSGPKRRRTGKRKLSRTPSLIAAEFGITSLKPGAFEITGLTTRPLIRKKKKRKR